MTWLATDRNYLPIREESYSSERPEPLPVTIGTLSDLREIGPGVWFPFEACGLSFMTEGSVGLAEGRLVLTNREDDRVQRAVLDPQVPPAWFRESPAAE